MDYEPNKFELVELEFKHAVKDVAEHYHDKVDVGDAMNIMADLMIQRFQYVELATKELYNEIAHNRVSTRVSIGMLNHNTDMLERIIKAYPEQFNIVWSIYVTTFMKIHHPGSIYLKKAFFNYKIGM